MLEKFVVFRFSFAATETKVIDYLTQAVNLIKLQLVAWILLEIELLLVIIVLDSPCSTVSTCLLLVQVRCEIILEGVVIEDSKNKHHYYC